MIDVSVNREEAVQHCKSNLNFFAAVGLPEVCTLLFPKIFLAIWQLITDAVQKDRGQDKLCIGLPRGFAKTLILKLFVAYCVLFTDRKFILIICNTATLAENFLADVMDLLSSRGIVMLFGDWRLNVEKETQPLKKFAFRGRSITIAGLGSQSSLRGLQLKYVRPDVMIMDDMQSKEEAASQTESDKLLQWMLGTLMKANNKRRCLFIFVGNMYPYEGSILKKLKVSDVWISFIFGAILEDGESIWPELRSVEDLLEELHNDESMGHPEIFYAEVMNDDVAGTRAGVDISKFNADPALREGQEEFWEGGFVIIDPSLGKKKSDEVAIGVVLIKEGEPVLREIAVGKFNPKQCVEKMINFAVKWQLLALVVEAVAYQGTLGFWINEKKTELGLHALKVLEINPEGEQKNSRIIDALKCLVSLASPRILLHQSVRAAVQHQTIYWDPMKKQNKDDLLDIIAYIWKVIKKHKHSLLTWVYEVNQVNSSFSDDLQLEF